MERFGPMKPTNKILSTALSLGLILSPIASVGAKDASKETVSPQKARVGTGTTAGATDGGGGLKADYVVAGIAAAALLAIVLEAAFDGKKDRGVTPPPPGPGPGTGPTTPPATPPATTTTTTTTSSGN